MTKKKPSPQAALPPAGLRLAIRLLLAATSLLAVYLVWLSFGGQAVAGCGPESSCQAVLNSRWAYWFGLPVSLPALLLYLTALGATSRLGPPHTLAQRRQAWRILVLAAWTILWAATWFIILQIAILKEICPFCMTAHGLGLATALLLLFSAPWHGAPHKGRGPEQDAILDPPLARKLILLSLAGLAGLVAGQTLHQRPTYHVQAVPEGLTEELTPGEGRVLSVFDDRHRLILDRLPLIGSAAAPHVALSLFDYSCHYCRIMHHRLQEVQRLLSNQLAIVHLPMPLDEKCNPTVAPGRTSPEHTNACQYASLGLAVWRVNREKYPQFDEWMFRSETVPPLADALGFARQLIGQEELVRGLQDPWVRRQIARDVAIYSTSYLEYHQGNMPQLIIGTNITTGTLTTNQLLRLLENQFGLPTRLPATPRAATPDSRTSSEVPARLVGIFGGRFTLNLDELPMIGNKNASQIILSLFDYTCKYCRVMHDRLLATQQVFGSQLAILNLPMPLDEQCNHTISPGGTPPDHTNACQYARLGLALWRLDPVKHAQFEKWIYQSETTPPLEAVSSYAQNLADPGALARALQDPWIDRQIATNVAIYATSYYAYQRGAMPQLFVTTNIITGSVATEQLIPFLAAQLGIRPEQAPPQPSPPRQ